MGRKKSIPKKFVNEFIKAKIYKDKKMSLLTENLLKECLDVNNRLIVLNLNFWGIYVVMGIPRYKELENENKILIQKNKIILKRLQWKKRKHK